MARYKHSHRGVQHGAGNTVLSTVVAAGGQTYQGDPFGSAERPRRFQLNTLKRTKYRMSTVAEKCI